jgi:hypothetical protein
MRGGVGCVGADQVCGRVIDVGKTLSQVILTSNLKLDAVALRGSQPTNTLQSSIMAATQDVESLQISSNPCVNRR